jgi:hypothetical protein
MLDRADADSLRRLPLVMVTIFCPFALAQRARCAAAIRARPPADMVLLRTVVPSADSALLRLSS